MAGWLGRALRGDRSFKLPAEAAEAAAEELLVMDEALEEILELPGLEQVRRKRELPHGFLRLWKRALGAYDAYIKLTLQFAHGGKGLAVRCEVGCHGCCQRPPTGVHAIELLAIYHRSGTSPDLEALEDAPTGPCGFLDPDAGTCRIYEVRPISCRMHFSQTDPELCWPGNPRARRARIHDLLPPQSILKTIDEIARRMDLASLSPVLPRGLATLGSEVLDAQPLSVAEPRRRLERRNKDDR